MAKHCKLVLYIGVGNYPRVGDQWIGNITLSGLPKSPFPRKGRRKADSLENFQKAQDWLSNCVNNHAGTKNRSCENKSPVKLPSRLVDLSDLDSNRIRIIVTAQGSKGVYAALSYCWGPSSFFTTTSKTLPARMAGFPPSDLPKTLRDAVVVTRRLGIQYLWVDALCILQGSDDVAMRDWMKEGSRMEQIYAHAYVTIIAAASENSDGGLFRSRDFQMPFRRNHDDPSKVKEGFVRIIIPAKEIKDEPINRRAWALQERLLSPRILTYASSEIFWQCNFHSVGERHPDGLQHKDKYGAFAYRLPAKRPDWNKLVADYCSRQLSNSDDKLPAIAGLARRYTFVTRDRYCAGHWLSTLFESLLWNRFEEGYGSNPDLPSKRLRKYRAPSWSWASMDGAISWIYPEQDIQYAKVISCYASPVSHLDPYGRISWGYLQICGPLARVAHEDGPKFAMRGQPNDNGVIFLDDQESIDVRKAHELGDLYVLFLYERCGLVLLSLQYAPNFYLRLGVFNNYKREDVKDLFMKVIVII
ncbi:heterokaryon incompatibility protein-domain-containing protein [Tricladium varicosporioides]|nr:heterokaryon incompatibility protein-domain-containing protein [Hymenoscyphus varicosporioides]